MEFLPCTALVTSLYQPLNLGSEANSLRSGGSWDTEDCAHSSNSDYLRRESGLLIDCFGRRELLEGQIVFGWLDKGEAH
jgi:hypothetical protein